MKKLFLTAGILAGPLFIVGSVVHGLLRDGFDMVRHPASLLLLGDLGWIQIMIFVLSGLCFIAGGIGMRSVVTFGLGRKWVTPLIIILGIAMIAGGVFVPDPGLGFPPGAPAGVPKTMSWHSAIHAIAPILGFVALVLALIILGCRFGKADERGWKWMTIIIALVTFMLSFASNLTSDFKTGEFNFIPLWLGAALGFMYTSLVIVKVKNESAKLKNNKS